MERIRPLPGYLWCEKIPTIRPLPVDGLGTVTVSSVTPSGLAIVSDRTEENDAVRDAYSLVVRSLGADPPAWHTFVLDRERTWPCGTWAEQKIREGTVVVVRAVSGLEQSRASRHIQIRYDEIAAIGAPLDEPDDAPAMYPGPGWVLVRLDEPPSDTHGSVYVGSAHADVFANSGVSWGTVYALPRGWADALTVGDRVAVPRWNATEYVDLEGNIRAVPWGDVLAVEGT